MIQIQSSSQNYKTAFLHLGFRPFFTGAALFAVISMSLWLAIYEVGLYIDIKTLPTILWHGHEMIYGYSLAVIAGAHFYTDTLSREGRAVVFHGPLIDPPPQLGNTLTVRRLGDDLVLEWSPPVSSGGEGPVTFYRVRRDTAPNGAFPVAAETYLPSWTDADAALAAGGFQAYLVRAENSGATLE